MNREDRNPGDEMKRKMNWARKKNENITNKFSMRYNETKQQRCILVPAEKKDEIIINNSV